MESGCATYFVLLIVMWFVLACIGIVPSLFNCALAALIVYGLIWLIKRASSGINAQKDDVPTSKSESVASPIDLRAISKARSEALERIEAAQVAKPKPQQQIPVDGVSKRETLANNATENAAAQVSAALERIQKSQEKAAERIRQEQAEKARQEEAIRRQDISDWKKATKLCPFLRRNMDDLDPDTFETWLCDLLRNLGYKNVIHVGGVGDFGLDATAAKDGTKYGFQCKYYSNPVGQDAVREAYAGIVHYECEKAVVVTNSTFTDAATTLADDCGVELWDGACLQGMIKQLVHDIAHPKDT